MYQSEVVNNMDRINLSTKDPNFWGIWGDEYQKKEASQRLSKWWGREQKNLPRELPSSKKIERVFNSFDKALEKINDDGTKDTSGELVSVSASHVWVDSDSVYLLMANHYDVTPQRIRDIFFEV